MTTIAQLPGDVRLHIDVHLAQDERYDVRLAEHDTAHHRVYGEVRLVIFTPGSPEALEYVAKRRKSGEVLASASPRTVPLDHIPAHIRQAALTRLKMATALL